MKFFCFALFVALAVAVSVEALPTGDAQEASQGCGYVCPPNQSNPVCAEDLNNKSHGAQLFDNECLLGLHNCNYKTNLVAVDKEKCSSSAQAHP